MASQTGSRVTNLFVNCLRKPKVWHATALPLGVITSESNAHREKPKLIKVAESRKLQTDR